MSGCVKGRLLVFPERNIEGFEVEARVLVDWLRKGKRFYRGESGVEVNIAGRLVGLLLFLQTSANIVAPQSAKAIIVSSSAVGPLSVPPAGVERSQTTLWVLWLSTIERTFWTYVAFALILGILFQQLVFLSGLALRLAVSAHGGGGFRIRRPMHIVCPL
jgi:hypothetical protein